MAFVLVAAGLLMIVTGARGTYTQFGQQVASDFTGKQSFLWWILAIGVVGSLGYIPALRTFSRLFMALILVVMLLVNKGFASQFIAAIKAGPTPPQANPPSGSGATTSQGTITIHPLNSSQPQSQSTSNLESWLPGSTTFSNFLLNPAGG